MLVEIFLTVLVLAVALLVTGDVARTKSESPHGHADGLAHDARPKISGAPGRGRADAFPLEPAGTNISAGDDADPTRHLENITPPAGGQPHSRTRPAPA